MFWLFIVSSREKDVTDTKKGCNRPQKKIRSRQHSKLESKYMTFDDNTPFWAYSVIHNCDQIRRFIRTPSLIRKHFCDLWRPQTKPKKRTLKTHARGLFLEKNEPLKHTLDFCFFKKLTLKTHLEVRFLKKKVSRLFGGSS